VNCCVCDRLPIAGYDGEALPRFVDQGEAELLKVCFAANRGGRCWGGGEASGRRAFQDGQRRE